MVWLKPRGAYTAFYGNRQFTLKPSMHDQMWELQVRAATRDAAPLGCGAARSQLAAGRP